jgi:hypothetical protein
MADNKEKTIERDQAAAISEGAKKDELGQKDLEKAVGGWTWNDGGEQK